MAYEASWNSRAESIGKLRWVKSSFRSSAEKLSTSLNRLARICVAQHAKRPVNSSSWLKAPSALNSTRWWIFWCASQPIQIDSSRRMPTRPLIRWRWVFAFITQFVLFAQKVRITRILSFAPQQLDSFIKYARKLESNRSSGWTPIPVLESESSITWLNSCLTRTWRRAETPKNCANCWSATSSSWNISTRTSTTTTEFICVKSSIRWTTWNSEWDNEATVSYFSNILYKFPEQAIVRKFLAFKLKSLNWSFSRAITFNVDLFQINILRGFISRMNFSPQNYWLHIWGRLVII